jgi:hypothetical protein
MAHTPLIDRVNTVYPGSTFADFGIENDFNQAAYSWEPKKSNHFIMLISGIPAFLIKSSAKPSLSNGEVTVDHINIQRYFKGKTVWNTISVTMYDAIVPSGAQAVMDWVRDHHESATGRDGYKTHYAREIKLQQLSPLGEVIEEWLLHNTFITESNFGTLDWSTEDVVNIEMTLRYDWAFFKK